MICPRCVASIADDSRYCPQCGQATTLSTEMQAGTVAVTSSELASEANEVSQALVHVSTHEATPVARIAPEKLHTQLTLANLCRLRREWSEAIDHCVNVLRAQPGNQTAHSLLSDIYRDQGKLDDAIQWIRLAIDLKPSPADMAKLQNLEAERTRLMRRGDARLLGSGASASMALAPEGGVSTGTMNLMGLAPRRWLNGMTLASMGFLGAVMVVLLIMQANHKNPPQNPTYVSSSFNAPAANASANSLLPPGILPSRSSGTSATSGAAANVKPVPPPPHATRTNLSAANLPTAPVLGVRPANPDPVTQPAPRAQGAAISVNSAPQGDPTALPGGMWIASVQFPSATNANIRIGLQLPNASAPDPEMRERIIRNVFRAAHRAFAAQEAVQRASVQAQAENSDAPLLTAALDRATANTLNPDTAPLAQLENSLQSLRWADPTPLSASTGIPGASP